MLPWERLRDKLLTLDGKPYASYKSLEGAYRFDRYVFYLDQVPLDPLGAPSLMRVRIDQAEARFPRDLWSTRLRGVAFEDYVARRWLDAIRKVTRSPRGSRSFIIDTGGQQILERTACRLAEDYLEVRGGVVLPAGGRKVVAKAAQAMLLEDLAQLVDAALVYTNQNPALAQRHIEVAEDAEALRTQLSDRGLVAFVADGAVLPRESDSDRPRLSRLVTSQSPEQLRVTLTPPHRGAVTGMGIRRGVTVIIGSTFSGKSTLLRAIAAGVYNHLPGDGRESCVTVGDAVLIRTDEGRRIEGVDLTPFVVSLPTGEDPTRYRTEQSSEIISQAAGIMEALEVGSSLLLVDEDTSAAGLLARDPLWRHLAPEGREPVIPLADIIRPLYEEHGVSTIVVTSASSDYIEVADTVIAMDAFHPRVVTAQAKQIAAGWLKGRSEQRGRFGGIHHRVPLPESVSPLRGRKLRTEVQSAVPAGPVPGWPGAGTGQGPRSVVVGRDVIDLARVEQLVDPGQARAIGTALVFAASQGYVDGARTLREILALIEMAIGQRGLDALGEQDGPAGDHALPRRQEMAAAFNRLRTLRVKS